MNTLNGYSKSTLTDNYVLSAAGGHLPLVAGRLWRSLTSVTIEEANVVWYIKVEIPGYSRPSSMLILGSYNNIIDYGLVEFSGFSNGYIYRNIQQNGGNVTAVCMSKVHDSTTKKWTFWIKMRPINNSSGESPALSATYKIYFSESYTITATATTTDPGVVWQNTTTNLVIKNADLIGKSTNIAGGAKGSIPYQSAANTTTMLGIGSKGQILKVNNSGLPEWSSDNDTKVTQTITSSNANYPLLLAPSGQTSTTTGQSYFDSEVTLNPSTNLLDKAKVYESLLEWGGYNVAADVSPIDAAMSSEFAQNRLAFLNPDLITIEFTRDDGASWYTYPKQYTDAGTEDAVITDYEFITNEQKQKLVTDGLSHTLWLGSRRGNQTSFDKLRITILGDGIGLYIKCKKILFNYSQAYGTGSYCLVEAAMANAPDTFNTIKLYNISGWTNWNSIPYIGYLGEFPNSSRAANTRKLRLTFGVTGVTENSTTDIFINKLRIFGTNSHAGGNSLTLTGHLYSFDVYKNATFPANLISTGSLTVKGNTTLGNATTDTITIKGKTTIEAGAGLVLKGNSAQNPLITRSVKGSDGVGNVGPLYLQFGANNQVILGNKGEYSISADGSQYSGTAAAAIKATQDGNGRVIANTYLPLTGGTTTGLITLGASSYENTIKWANSDFNSATAKAFMGSLGDWIVRVTYVKDLDGNAITATNSDLRYNRNTLKIGSHWALTSGNWSSYIDLSTYATQAYVTSEIAKAQLAGSNVVIPVTDVLVKTSGNFTTVVSENVAKIDLSAYAIAADYVKKSGDTMTGDLTIKKNSSEAPSIIFQRGETNDTFDDWKLTNAGGYFKIQNRHSGNIWIDVLSLASADATKNLTSSYSVLPSANNTLTLGNSTYTWKDVYATNFKGNADTATTSYTIKYHQNSLYNDNDDVNKCYEIGKLKLFRLNRSDEVDGKYYAGSCKINGSPVSYGFPVTDHANSLLWVGTHDNNYGHQLGFSSDGNIYHRRIINGGYSTLTKGGSWKKIAFTSDIPTQATDSVLGCIKIGYTQSDKNYPVQLDSDNKAFVNVPWTTPLASQNAIGGIKLKTDIVNSVVPSNIQQTNNYPPPRLYAVETTQDGTAFVCIPWTDTKVTQTVTTANDNYPLLLAPSGQTSTTTTTSYFDSGVTLNPANNILSGAKVYESLLQWGNINISGSLSPLDVAMDSQWSSNRLSFMPASGIDIKYSTDGGTTWFDYGSTDDQKRSLVTTGLSYSLSPGKNTTRQKINSDRVRVTVTAESGKTYFSLKKIYMYISQNGANGCKVLIEKSQCGSDTSFTQVGEYSITGWSGWNSIPLIANFGGGDDQTTNIRRLRFTYYFTTYSTGYGETNDKKAVQFTINKINMIGETSWRNSGGDLPATGHIYSYDINKNVTFPAGITTTSNLTVKGNTTLGDTASDTVTVNGETTFKNKLVLSPSDYNNTLKIANTDYPAATSKIFMGADGDFVIRSTFASDSSTSDLRWNKTSLKVGNYTVIHNGSLENIDLPTIGTYNLWLFKNGDATRMPKYTEFLLYIVDANHKYFNIEGNLCENNVKLSDKYSPKLHIVLSSGVLEPNTVQIRTTAIGISGITPPELNQVATYVIITKDCNCGTISSGITNIKWIDGLDPSHTCYNTEIVITGFNNNGDIFYRGTYACY